MGAVWDASACVDSETKVEKLALGIPFLLSFGFDQI